MERKTMRKDFGAKAILYLMPALIIGTYDENRKPNAMNVAWGGISEETQISIFVETVTRLQRMLLLRFSMNCLWHLGVRS